MNWAVRQLCSPLGYLRIRQGHGLLTSKATYDIVIPAFIAAVLAGGVWYYSLSLGVFAETGLVTGVINLLNLLIAFFIAALAAVATFDRAGLDEPVKGEPATMLRRRRNNVEVNHILTHRQFVCYMFGFLSFSSLALLISLYVVRVIGPSSWFGYPYMGPTSLLKFLGSFAFFFVVSQITVTTLLSLYFLTDRLQFMHDAED